MRYPGFQGTNSRHPTDLALCSTEPLQGVPLGGENSTGRDVGEWSVGCSASSAGSLAALVHEGGGSRSGNRAQRAEGTTGGSPPGDDFSGSAQLYSRG